MTIETIKAVLILNNIALGIGAAALAVCFLLWIRAEIKLAKHGESWFFKPKARKHNAKEVKDDGRQ